MDGFRKILAVWNYLQDSYAFKIKFCTLVQEKFSTITLSLTNKDTEKYNMTISALPCKGEESKECSTSVLIKLLLSLTKVLKKDQ